MYACNFCGALFSTAEERDRHEIFCPQRGEEMSIHSIWTCSCGFRNEDWSPTCFACGKSKPSLTTRWQSHRHVGRVRTVVVRTLIRMILAISVVGVSPALAMSKSDCLKQKPNHCYYIVSNGQKVWFPSAVALAPIHPKQHSLARAPRSPVHAFKSHRATHLAAPHKTHPRGSTGQHEASKEPDTTEVERVLPPHHHWVPMTRTPEQQDFLDRFNQVLHDSPCDQFELRWKGTPEPADVP
jgi:hypothetical protein